MGDAKWDMHQIKSNGVNIHSKRTTTSQTKTVSSHASEGHLATSQPASHLNLHRDQTPPSAPALTDKLALPEQLQVGPEEVVRVAGHQVTKLGLVNGAQVHTWEISSETVFLKTDTSSTASILLNNGFCLFIGV